MARYDFECRECGHKFEIQERMSEHEDDTAPGCPECGGRDTRQLLTEFYPDTSDKT